MQVAGDLQKTPRTRSHREIFIVFSDAGGTIIAVPMGPYRTPCHSIALVSLRLGGSTSDSKAPSGRKRDCPLSCFPLVGKSHAWIVLLVYSSYLSNIAVQGSTLVYDLDGARLEEFSGSYHHGGQIYVCGVGLGFLDEIVPQGQSFVSLL